MSGVTILDDGLGNTKSVLRAFESIGVRARLCADPDQVRQAERLALPGVGAFGDGVAAFPEQPSDVLAQVRYGDQLLTAAVARDNVVGVQFHPEKSGAKGIALLRAFVGTST